MDVKQLQVKIGADPHQYEKAMKGVSARLQKHKAQFQKAGMAMTAAGSAIVGSLGLMVKGYVKAGDEVHKMALRTGLSTETLSEFRYAAEIAGADIGALEKGVKKMAKTIVDAGDGLTTYQRAFKRINIDHKELLKLSPEKQFLKIAAAISDVENPTIRAAAAQDIFGRAGTQLLPLFAEGSKGLDNLRKKAHEMGIVFDQEAANKAAKLADASTTLKASLKGVTMAIAEKLVPAITKIVDKIGVILVKMKTWMAVHPKLAGVITKVALAIGVLMLVLGPLVIMLPSIAGGMMLVEKSATLMAAKAKILAVVNRVLGTSFTTMLGPIGLVIAAIAGLIAVGYLVVKNWKTISAFLKKVWGNIASFFKAVWQTIGDNVKAAMNFIIKIFHAVSQPIIKIAKFIGEGTIKAFNWLGNKAKDIFNWMAQKIIGAMQWLMSKLAKIPIVKKFAKNLHEALEETNAKLSSTKDRVDEASLSIKEKMVPALVGGKLALKDVEYEVGNVEDKMKSWLDYLKSIGIKTISQKEQAIKSLEGRLAELDAAYKKGEISLSDYFEATGKVKDQIKALDRTIKTLLPERGFTPLEPLYMDVYTFGAALTKMTERGFADIKEFTLGAAEMAEKLKKKHEETTKAIDKGWKKVLSTLGMLVQILSDEIGGAFGKLVSVAALALDQVANNFDKLKKEGKLTAKGIITSIGPQLWGKIGGSIGEMVSGAKESFASLGAAIGSTIGSLLGPLGSALGSLIGGIFGGLFKKVDKALEEAQKKAKNLEQMIKDVTRVSSKWGEITEQTARAISKLSQDGLPGYIAVSKLYYKVISDVGITQQNINSLWERTSDIIDHLIWGEISLADATKSLDESFKLLVKGAKELGQEGSKAMIDFIIKVRESGIEVKSVTDYILSQLDRVAPALMTLINNFRAKWDTITRKIARLTKIYGNQMVEWFETVDEQVLHNAEKVERRLGGLAKITKVTFDAMKAEGRPFIEILKAMQEPLEALRKKYEELGIKVPDYLQPMFDLLEKMEMKPRVLENLDAATTILEALRNSAYLTQDTFHTLIQSVKSFARSLADLKGPLGEVIGSAEMSAAKIRMLFQTMLPFLQAAATFGLVLPKWMREFIEKQYGKLPGQEGITWKDLKKDLIDPGVETNKWLNRIQVTLGQIKRILDNKLQNIRRAIGDIGGFQQEGIAWRPQLAWLAESRRPEAIVDIGKFQSGTSKLQNILTGPPGREGGQGRMDLNVNIYAQRLDDRTIDEAAEKIFVAVEKQKRRRGY